MLKRGGGVGVKTKMRGHPHRNNNTRFAAAFMQNNFQK